MTSGKQNSNVTAFDDIEEVTLEETDVIKMYNEISSTATAGLALCAELGNSSIVEGCRKTIGDLVKKQERASSECSLGNGTAGQLDLMACNSKFEDIAEGLQTVMEDLINEADKE